MKLHDLKLDQQLSKLRNAVVLNDPQMKATRGGYDDPIDGGYLPELVVLCSRDSTINGGGGRCWKEDEVLGKCIFTGNQTHVC